MQDHNLSESYQGMYILDISSHILKSYLFIFILQLQGILFRLYLSSTIKQDW